MEQRRILADHSYRELLSLLDWFYLHGPIPIIIGGWAVFFYNSYLGSVDIDLVGPSMGGQIARARLEFNVFREAAHVKLVRPYLYVGVFVNKFLTTLTASFGSLVLV